MALYHSIGRISEMSEVQSGTSKNGFSWQRMTLTLEIPGYQGSVTKQIFQVSGDNIDNVLKFDIGDKVDVSFSLYAREWNGRWYNNVDLVKIDSQEEIQETPAPAKSAPKPKSKESLDPEENPDDLPF